MQTKVTVSDNKIRQILVNGTTGMKYDVVATHLPYVFVELPDIWNDHFLHGLGLVQAGHIRSEVIIDDDGIDIVTDCVNEGIDSLHPDETPHQHRLWPAYTGRKGGQQETCRVCLRA